MSKYVEIPGQNVIICLDNIFFCCFEECAKTEDNQKYIFSLMFKDNSVEEFNFYSKNECEKLFNKIKIVLEVL